MVLPLKNFSLGVKIFKSSPLNNGIISYIVFFFNSTPKKILSFCCLPLNCPQPEAECMDIKIITMPNDSTVMINSTLEIDLPLDEQTQGHLSSY